LPALTRAVGILAGFNPYRRHPPALTRPAGILPASSVRKKELSDISFAFWTAVDLLVLVGFAGLKVVRGYEGAVLSFQTNKMPEKRITNN